MAYMQKYPTLPKPADRLATAAELAVEVEIADPERFGRGEDAFNWPPPSATTRTLPGRSRR